MTSKIDSKQNDEIKGKRVWIVTFGLSMYTQKVFSSFKKAQEFKYENLNYNPKLVVGIGEWMIQ